MSPRDDNEKREWRALDDAVAEVTREDERDLREVRDELRHEIVRSATARRGGTVVRFPVRKAGFGAAAATLAAAALALVFFTGDPEPAPTPAPAIAHQVIAAPPDAPRAVAIGDDRVGMTAGGAITVTELEGVTRIALQRGAVACAVAKRGDGELFYVTAGQFTVQVVGTRFLVDRGEGDELTVAVTEGAVAVSGPEDEIWSLAAGERLSVARDGTATVDPVGDESSNAIAALLRETTGEVAAVTPDEAEVAVAKVDAGRRATRSRPAAKKAATDLSTLRRLVATGKLDEALPALEKHLRQRPGDHEAWSLLADARRKSGNHAGAVKAYRKVVAHGGGAAANRARYKAAILLQDRLGRHAEAASLLQAYLTAGPSSSTLKAEARTRLSRCRDALNSHRD